MWEGSKTFKWARQIHLSTRTLEDENRRGSSGDRRLRTSRKSPVALRLSRDRLDKFHVDSPVKLARPSCNSSESYQAWIKVSDRIQALIARLSFVSATNEYQILINIWAKSVLFITWQLSTKEKTAPWNVNERVIALVTVSVMMCTMMCIDVSWCMDQLCLLESCCRSCQTKCKSILTGRTQNLQPKLCSFL